MRSSRASSYIFAAGLLVAATQALAAPHAPIVINSDAGFTAANGVSNPVGCGTAVNPCIVQNWEINTPPGGTCISISNTTRFYVVRNNTCTNGLIGIALSSAPNGTVTNNTIQRLRGTAGGDPHGIDVLNGNNMRIADNRLNDIQGQASGRSAIGIVLFQTSNATVVRNNISQLIGAAGQPGAPGTVGNPNGSNGGQGGSAIAILAPALGANNLTIQQNMVSQLFAGMGGAGGNGSFTGGSGGFGGTGGSAYGVFTDGVNAITTQANNISLLFSGMGGAGGLGFGGGNGGVGGAAGDADGMRFNSAVGINNVNNIITSLSGANGGMGGFAIGGGTGGNGGKGGDAVGIRYVSSAAFTHVGNVITNLFAGLGGFGGMPGGVNGAPGVATPILVQ